MYIYYHFTSFNQVLQTDLCIKASAKEIWSYSQVKQTEVYRFSGSFSFSSDAPIPFKKKKKKLSLLKQGKPQKSNREDVCQKSCVNVSNVNSVHSLSSFYVKCTYSNVNQVLSCWNESREARGKQQDSAIDRAITIQQVIIAQALYTLREGEKERQTDRQTKKLDKDTFCPTGVLFGRTGAEQDVKTSSENGDQKEDHT